MILAFDTCYYDDKAKTVCIAFEHWTANSPAEVFTEVATGIAPYEPGAFYKRELPCIMSLLQQITLPNIEAIIVDGFVYLDDNNLPGLGAHLYHQLNGSIPVIGVAKTNFKTVETNKTTLTRGISHRPLYITAIGIDLTVASRLIEQMDGPHRIPALLKQLDTLSRVLDK